MAGKTVRVKLINDFSGQTISEHVLPVVGRERASGVIKRLLKREGCKLVEDGLRQAGDVFIATVDF